MHIDLCENDNDLPVVALLALDDGVRLGCYANSHKCTNEYPDAKHRGETEMVFGPNESMIFHPLVDGATLTHIVTIAEGEPMNSNHLHAAKRKARAERAEKNEAFGFKAREAKRIKQVVALAREATL